MAPLYRPGPVTGKRPPMVLLRGVNELVDLGDGQGWPKMLALLPDVGRLCPCNIPWCLDTSNEPNLGPPRFDKGRLAS